MKRAQVGTALVALVLVAPSSATAQSSTPAPTPGGYIGDGGLGAGVGDPGGQPVPGGQSVSDVLPTAPGGSEGSGSSGAGGQEPSTRWVRHYYGEAPDVLVIDGPGYGTNAPYPCPEGARAYTDTLVDVESGAVLATASGCEEAATTGPAAPTTGDEPAPLPPRPEEIWSVVPVPTPGFGINPGIRGLTGLDSYLWDSQGNAPVVATATIRGYTTTATAVPTHWEWRMWEEGDTPNVNPYPVVSASFPGTREAPAATYMYETVGDYTLTMSVTWSGTYSFTAPGGGPPQTVDLGTTTRSSSRDYHVIEIRSARVG